MQPSGTIPTRQIEYGQKIVEIQTTRPYAFVCIYQRVW